MNKPIHISLPSTGEEEWQALREPIESGWLTQGPKVAEFEKQFAQAHVAKHALATTSCTTGLHLALVAMGIGKGDEVIVPAFSWVATANVVLYCDATPVFVDIDRTTFNLDPQKLIEKISSKTKAIIAVHLFGLCANINAIKEIIPAHIKILEDAACAAGAIYNNQYAGTLGDAAVFSFHPRKTITTGEGGMITTQDDDLATSINQLRNHGASISEEQRHHGSKPYILPEFNILGFNYRMTDLQGAVGIKQLAKLEGFIKERAQWAAYYREQLSDINWLHLPQEPKHNGRHAWQAFVTYVLPEKAPYPRNEIMDKLAKQSIATRPGTHAIHMLGYYKDHFSFTADNFPAARDCNDHTMAIPLHNRMKKNDYERVVEALKAI